MPFLVHWILLNDRRNAQKPILEGLERIEQMVYTPTVAPPVYTPLDSASPSASAVGGRRTQHVASRVAVRSTFASTPWKLSKSWATWGLRGSFVAINEGEHTESNIQFSISLPLARLLGSYALTGCLSLRSASYCRSALTLRHPSYFAVARVVDESHPFMHACAMGDVKAIRSMLRSGESRPTDVTSQGYTPLSVSTNFVDCFISCRTYRCPVCGGVQSR